MNNAPHVCPLCHGEGTYKGVKCEACDGKRIVWPPNAYYPVPQPWVPVQPSVPTWRWMPSQPAYCDTTGPVDKRINTTITLDGQVIWNSMKNVPYMRSTDNPRCEDNPKFGSV